MTVLSRTKAVKEQLGLGAYVWGGQHRDQGRQGNQSAWETRISNTQKNKNWADT